MTHRVLLEGDTNAASRFLNYASSTLSSRTSPGLLGRIMGPNTFGEVSTVVSVERVIESTVSHFTAGTRAVGTRLGFRYGIVPGSKADQIAKMTADHLRQEESRDAGDREWEELYVEDPKGGVELEEHRTRTVHGRARGPERSRRGVKR